MKEEMMRLNRNHYNTSGLRRIPSHPSDLMQERRRRPLRRPDKNFSRRMLHLHLLRIPKTSQLPVQMKYIESPSFHGINELEEFLMRYEEEVSNNQIFLSLDIALKATSGRWWGANKQNIQDWYQCKRLLHIRFSAEQKRRASHKYNGHRTPTKHLEQCRT
jgi:hypothetical protein